jgi:opacity protein-like surface antigen
MNTLIRIAIVMLLACGLAAAGSAYKVETAEVTPDGDLQAGVPVTVSAVVDFPTTAGTSFPTQDTFSLFSELENPRWNWAVDIGGNKNPKPEGYGKFFKISGFELEYPKESTVKLHVTLDGTVPNVSATQNITVLRFQHLDQSSKVRDNGEYTLVRKIVNPEDVARDLEAARTSLGQLRSAIDERTAQGANTTEAERKYAEADRLLKSAESGTVSMQSNTAQRARDLIDEATSSLDLVSAEAQIERAAAQIRNVDEMLTFFKANRDLANDPRVAAITVKREGADQLLTSARDSQADGNLNQARIRANESATKALEAYNDSVDLRSQFAGTSNTSTNASATTDGGGFLPYIIVVVVIAVIAIGVVVFQRRGRWDELG